MKTIGAMEKKDREFTLQLKKVKRGYRSNCWEFTGVQFDSGYGRVLKKAKSQTVVRAHRYAFYLAHGKLKKTTLIRHKCDNRLCCNPSHLEEGTHTENMKDMTNRSRSAKGVHNGNSILTDMDVKVIKWLNQEMFFSLDQIAIMLGVGRTTIHRIVTGCTWAHVAFEHVSISNFKKYLKQRIKAGAPLVTPGTKFLNWRDESDVEMAAILGITYTQQRTATKLGVSRNSIRNCIDKSERWMSISEAKTRYKEYNRWKLRYTKVIELIKKTN